MHVAGAPLMTWLYIADHSVLHGMMRSTVVFFIITVHSLAQRRQLAAGAYLWTADAVGCSTIVVAAIKHTIAARWM